MNSSQIERWPYTAFWVVLAMVAVLYFHWHVARYELVHHLLAYSWAPWLSLSESDFLVVWWVTALPATAFLAIALGRAWPIVDRALQKVAQQKPQHAMLLIGLCASLATLFIRLLVTRGADFTDDERMYWYQGMALLDGRITAEMPQPLAAFLHQFHVIAASGDRLGGIYPIGQPGLLAAGSLIGASHLGQMLAVFATVFFAGHLTERLFGSGRLGILASALCALSPMLLFMGATRHNVVPATCCLLIAVWGACELGVKAPRWRALVAGMAVGATWLFRPDDGLIATGVVGMLWAHAFLTRPIERKALVQQALIGAVALAALIFVQLSAYAAITGSPLVTPYYLWVAQQHPLGTKLFGFGFGPWDIRQSISSSISKTLMAWVRIDGWILGWPFSLAGVAAALSLPTVRRAGVPLLLTMALILLLCWLFIAPSVHDFGSSYHLVAVPFVTSLTAGTLGALGSRWSAERIGPWVVASLCVALLTFWPVQAQRLHFVAQNILAPVEAAERTEPEKQILVLWKNLQGPGPSTSWVYFPPLSTHLADERVVWAKDNPALYPELVRNFPDREVYRLDFGGPMRPRLVPASLGSPPSSTTKPHH